MNANGLVLFEDSDTMESADSNSGEERSYSLRPRTATRREETEEETIWKPRPRKKSKQKSLPLSKYRRKTANARERFRMREINEAFESLRKAVPHLTAGGCDNPNEKLTKISTLRLAMKYITALSNALHDDLTDSDADSGNSANPELRGCSPYFFSSSPPSSECSSSYSLSALLTPSSCESFCDPLATTLLDELDSLPSPAVDLDDFLIT